MSTITLSLLEWTAVVLNVGFTLCIAYEKRIGWALGFAAGVIGVGLYALAQTWAMASLNVYYVVMAVYGGWSWGKGEKENGMRTQSDGVRAGLVVGGRRMSTPARC